MVTDKLITASVKDFAQDKDYLNAFIVALASKWSIDEPIVISTADAESLKKYFAAHAKALLDKGVTIQQVNGIKTLFTVSPADGSYKVNFGEEEEFMNYFKAVLASSISKKCYFKEATMSSKVLLLGSRFAGTFTGRQQTELYSSRF